MIKQIGLPLRSRPILLITRMTDKITNLRCFDTVFQRPYRYSSIPLKVFFSLSDRYKIFTSNWLLIEICENVVLSKIDITMTTINKKKLKLIKAEFCMI